MNFAVILLSLIVWVSPASAVVETLKIEQTIINKSKEIDKASSILVFSNKQVATLNCVAAKSGTKNFVLEFKVYKSLKGFDYNIVDSMFYYHPNGVFLNQANKYLEISEEKCILKKSSLSKQLDENSKIKKFNNKMLKVVY